ncbi:hypothetical protein EV641_106103 [Rhodococcus sp. SMB37]|uniref:hypothetical protein n=1 Tax=Rhodococcus sp. SMB37 TaxID=2512213 RepID=UPI00104DA918|nr:hypothetical protein [Rhodococcus sp. SMB37]TCN53459.1 hypothetical protein EV641_106103 [Rhodococcus sp. SMB37]
MTGPGLDGWVEPFPEAPILRRLREPVAVVVDISHVLPGSLGFARADQLPLRVRAGGVQLEAAMPADLWAWLRVADGRWLAQVYLPVRSANGLSSTDLWLWVESSYVVPVDQKR